MGFSKNLLLDP